MVGSAAPRGFNCGNCGAAVELRALHHAQAVVCTSCGAILDPRDPNVHILQTAQLKERIRPEIPLGSRGTWHDQPWEVIGFQRRSIEVEAVRYSWDEYLLFNPYRGFRYLSNYEGHWNDIRTVRELPEALHYSGPPRARYRGDTYQHFQNATARTDFVLGEFPWRVRVGDSVEVDDYISPPQMLSSERTEQETTWSLGVYTDARQIWKAFGVVGVPRKPSGIFANQPSPYRARLRSALLTFMGLGAVLLALLAFRVLTADRERVFTGKYVFQPNTPESSFVTEPFTLARAGTIAITVRADRLRNAWLDFDLALVNADAGAAWNVTREVSYYSGSDSDGPWSEDERQRDVLLPRVPAGQYYLRVEPEGGGIAAEVPYTIQVRRDMPLLLPYGIAALVLLGPVIVIGLLSQSFERRRLQEGDYGE